MKVLHISLSNIGGGASKIANSLNKRLNEIGIESKLVILEGFSDHFTININSSLFFRFLFLLKNKIIQKILFFFKNDSYDYRSINLFPSPRLVNLINQSKVDIVHLHWIGSEMLSIRDIAKINKNIIWTLHDAWPLNGSYHINPKDYFNFENFNYSNCPDDSKFLERWMLNRKKSHLLKKNISFTAPSDLFVKKFECSLFNNGINKCYEIPNFIDLEKWSPVSKNIALDFLKLKTSKKIIVFGANNAITSYNKGFRFIKELVSLLPSSDFIFILFGENNFEYNFPSDSCEVINLGKIDSLEKMKMIYSVGDLTLTPSLSESFSMVSLESIACGTPVVAFENTGTSSVVRHKISGYLAQKSNIEDLIAGINWVCQNKFKSLHLDALNFEELKIVNMFKNLYISEFDSQTL